MHFSPSAQTRPPCIFAYDITLGGDGHNGVDFFKIPSATTDVELRLRQGVFIISASVPCLSPMTSVLPSYPIYSCRITLSHFADALFPTLLVRFAPDTSLKGLTAFHSLGKTIKSLMLSLQPSQNPNKNLCLPTDPRAPTFSQLHCGASGQKEILQKKNAHLEELSSYGALTLQNSS